MKLHSKLGRPKTAIFYIDKLTNYKSPSKPRCSVYVYVGQSKRKLAKTHVTTDYSWDVEVRAPLPPDVTENTVFTLRVMDNKREVGSTSIVMMNMPYETPHRKGKDAFQSCLNPLEEPYRRHEKKSSVTTIQYALSYSCWIRDIDGDSNTSTLPGEAKSSRSWKPFQRLKKALSKSNLAVRDDYSDPSAGNFGGLKKKSHTKSMYNLSHVPTSEESELLRLNGMLRQINLAEPCPPPPMRTACSLHDLAKINGDNPRLNDLPCDGDIGESAYEWAQRNIPEPPEGPEPYIRDIEPREALYGAETVISIFGVGLGNAGRDIERLSVGDIDVTANCYSEERAMYEGEEYDHIMFHITEKDLEMLPVPKPGDTLQRYHVEIRYKNQRVLRSLQRITILPPDAAEQAFQGADSDLSDAPESQPFDLDNFHPSSGAVQAMKVMVETGRLQAERCHDAFGEHVVVKPRVGSFSGAELFSSPGSATGICHAKNASMPHLGQCEAPPEVEVNGKASKEEVQRRRTGSSSSKRDHSATESLKKKRRRGSDKTVFATLPRFFSRSQLDLTDNHIGAIDPEAAAGGEDDLEEDSMADSAYDTLQKRFRRGPFRKRKSQSRSSSINSADLLEENQKLKNENRNLKEELQGLWKKNTRQSDKVYELEQKVYEMSEQMKENEKQMKQKQMQTEEEYESYMNDYKRLKNRLLTDGLHEYLCIDKNAFPGIDL